MAPKRSSDGLCITTMNKRARNDATPYFHGGQPMDIVFSFDTTGSMSSYLNAVKKNVEEMINRLFKDMPNLRIAVVAHGDYGDAKCKNCYVTKTHDFSSDSTELCKFVKSVGSTCGFDTEECYELVLKEVQDLAWTPGSQRSLVMIGDAPPHELEYFKRCSLDPKPAEIDWREETKNLYKMGVHIYGVQCGSGAETFYKELAKVTEGTYLKLNDFSNIYDMLMAICYRERDPDMLQAYEHEVRGRGMIHPEMDRMFHTLKASGPVSGVADTKATPTASSVTKTPKKVTVKVAPRKTAVPKVSKLGSRKLNTSYCKRVKKTPAVTLEWSKWVKCMCLEPCAKYKVTVPRKYRSRSLPPAVGHKRRSLFARTAEDKNCVYEFGVRLPTSGTIYVTYVTYDVQRKGTTVTNWEKTLLRPKHIKEQIDDVLSQGCDLFVRRAVCKPGCKGFYDPSYFLQDKRNLCASVYDYAWCKIACHRRSHKTVVRDGYTISDEVM